MFFTACKRISTASVFVLAAAVTVICPAQEITPDMFTGLTYRNLGPFRAGAWIEDIAVPENPGPEHQYTFYAASRTGGVWKTENNGTTFEPVFDDYGVNAVGAVAVAPSDPEIVWVGTGDNSNARSSYYGNGVYKSTDDGKTFTCMGLTDSHHIARIVIHPSNPYIVYVAAMGHLFSANSQRGVFRTIDGGKTWDNVLYISDLVGVVDLCIDPQHPEVLYAASYDKGRTPWHFEAGGKKSRIYKTTDSGDTWQELSGGLPQGNLGRIGIAVHRSNPDILYAVIQNLNPDPDYQADEQGFDEFTDHSYDSLIGGEVYRTSDAGTSWDKVSEKGVDVSGKAAYSFNEISVDPVNPDNVYIIGVYMQYSFDGGRTWPRSWKERDRFLHNFGDVRVFWIDPHDPEHMMLGSDGGLYSTWDAGRTTFHHYNIPMGEVYDVEVDNAAPYNIYAGLQDHETWKGPVNSWSGAVGLEDWVITGMWDGMYTVVNPDDNRWLYFTTQFGKHHRVDQAKGTRKNIRPRAPHGEPPYRFTWTTPLELSPHNSDIVYAGAQKLLRSLDRGDTWEELSGDLTTNDPVKIAGQGHMMYCTITTISESPLKPGLIYIGTDDGRVHVTENHGASWRESTAAVAAAGGPDSIWVSRIAASSHDVNTAYLTKSGYRRDDFQSYVYRTTDAGNTWEDISADLPEAPVSVIIEDRVNPDLLFAGTDKGVFFTLNRGQSWLSLRNNMPPVPVRDLCVHSPTGDLVAGSYGRGVWVINISPLQQMNNETAAEEFHLFDVIPGHVNNRSQRAGWGNYHMTGDNNVRVPNEREGLKIFCYQKETLAEPLHMTVSEIEGSALDTLVFPNKKGIGYVYWNSNDGKPGTYIFTVTGGTRRMSVKGVLKSRLTWPVGRMKDF